MPSRWIAASFFLSGILLNAPISLAFDPNAYLRHLEITRDLDGDDLIASRAPYGPYRFTLEAGGEAPCYWSELDSLFGFTDGERALVSRHGFMVSERLSFPSYGEAFGGLWEADMPVFISTDAILHAVHRSYDDLLAWVETYYLASTLEEALGRMHAAWQAAEAEWRTYPGAPAALDDVDIFLTVARSLLAGEQIPAKGNNGAAVTSLLDLIRAEQPARYPLFNETPRIMDFSQFTPRGHYTKSITLRRYFQAMMWLGRTEFRLTVPPVANAPESVDREILGAFLVRDLVSRGRAAPVLQELETTLRGLVGSPDNVTLMGLDALAEALEVGSPVDLFQPGTLDRVAPELGKGTYTSQAINSQILIQDPMNPQDLDPPYAFLLIGQRFVVDSYVTWNVVFDRIHYQGQKPFRMLPSPLDVLYCLGNDDVLPLLREDLNSYHYASNLSALRYLIDGYETGFWEESLYNVWLQAIRSVAHSGRQEGAPEFMRTGAWQQEKMNTQLAAWAELRHDNLLYAKQSYTGGVTCSFPATYVEPVPAFYGTLRGFAERAAEAFGRVPFEDPEYKDRVEEFFDRMADIMTTLESVAGKELQGVETSDEERQFLKDVLIRGSLCGGAEQGWYRELFFDDSEISASKADFIIADVHTAPTDANGVPVGEVLHVATGRPNFGVFVATPPGGEPTAFAGPVGAYHEHVTLNFNRMTDEEWRAVIKTGPPARPDWTYVYLADAEGNERQGGRRLVTEEAPPEPPEEPSPLPHLLAPALPNPFASETLVSFRVEGDGAQEVRLDVFDARGRRVKSLANEALAAGTYHVRWNGDDDRGMRLPAGLYFLSLRAGDETATRKVTLLP